MSVYPKPRILEKRPKEYVKGKLEEEQAKFRPEKQVNDNIFILRSLIERYIKEREEPFSKQSLIQSIEE